MAKKNRFYDYDEDDELVLDKKTKRRLAKSRNSVQQPVPQEEEEPVSDAGPDAFSGIAVLCQENRWREAVLLCRNTIAEAEAEGNEELALSMSMALGKLEMSLRRQMAAAVLEKAQELLKKEYGLDVGQQ